ncbi:FxSxx-COOH system tetratricopeptide repeat protein [Actinoplanes sp. NPDC049265]|uniref:FxSxx-COOH system tetratricopeptide repeat protein n=1 Tax=Actinoplanes sp. NPDC049265 TaxID=3363902 RepID=UPI003713C2E9
MKLRWSRRRGRVAVIAAVAALAAAGVILLARCGLADRLDGFDSLVWDWLERASWVAGLLAVLIAVLSARRTAGPLRAPEPPAPPKSEREPGSLPPLWNAPGRNISFVGRETILTDLRKRLASDGAAVVMALHGWGGVGKTQLAAEYAHRYSADYELVWWIAAEQTELLGEQFAALAAALGLVSDDSDASDAEREARAYLRRHGHWLVVFDNAEDPGALWPAVPAGPGHTIITSRNPAWSQVAAPVPIDVFDRAESTALLKKQVPALSDSAADQMAGVLGDLPLAIAQAGGMLAETGMPAETYLAELAGRAHILMAESPSPSYPVPLAATLHISRDRLLTEDLAAVQLFHLCCWLGPELIPVTLFTPDPSLPQELRDSLRTPLGQHRLFRKLSRFGLIKMDGDTLQLHRLVQAIQRDASHPDDHIAARRMIADLLHDARPDDGRDPRKWTEWAMLAPHILAQDPENSPDLELRILATDMIWYFLARGDNRTAESLALQWLAAWTPSFGPDDEAVLHCTNHLGQLSRIRGDYVRARRYDESAHQRFRRLFGENDRRTLTSACNLAQDMHRLGHLEVAREQHEDILRRRRETFGEDYEGVLVSASELASTLRDLGEREAAHELHRQTYSGYQRTLGPDHPDTLSSAMNVALDLQALGRLTESRRLHALALADFERVLGRNHPDTIRSAENLAKTLRELGRRRAARRLEADIAARRDGRQK